MSANDRLSQMPEAARRLSAATDEMRARTSPWDASRSSRVLESALSSRARVARRHVILRRGIAVGAGAMLLAFAVHALALPAASPAQASSSPSTGAEPTPCQKDCELATRGQSDGGYGTD